MRATRGNPHNVDYTTVLRRDLPFLRCVRIAFYLIRPLVEGEELIMPHHDSDRLPIALSLIPPRT